MLFWRIFVLLNSLKQGGVLIRKKSLTSCQLVLSQRRVTRSDVSFQTKQSKCLATVDLTLYTYRPQSEVLCDLYLMKFDLTKDVLFDTFFIAIFDQ